MGWKNIKEHYRIKHLVQVTGQGICIGSGYIHDIIVIGLDGIQKKRYDDRSNADLMRYQHEIDINPEKLYQLIQQPDIFSKSITVYTYNGGDIIEKQCESLGYPNITHDGEMMYENTFSADKDEIVTAAKTNSDCAIKFMNKRIKEAEERLKEFRNDLLSHEEDRAKLEEC